MCPRVQKPLRRRGAAVSCWDRQVPVARAKEGRQRAQSAQGGLARGRGPPWAPRAPPAHILQGLPAPLVFVPADRASRRPFALLGWGGNASPPAATSPGTHSLPPLALPLLGTRFGGGRRLSPCPGTPAPNSAFQTFGSQGQGCWDFCAAPAPCCLGHLSPAFPPPRCQLGDPVGATPHPHCGGGPCNDLRLY